ncbi:Vta1 like-domain-containing protein [Microdochium trichocladiopsis]|uniref:Vta1 like-domain-containing protein n=1 Tax=Microdochium trichocladiopsis TaxID=1682393 RepID=A0A9P8YAE4_9PEZI|nr:Vta1 like-domain-containing protein [Microdochium trichocladiopsis]KAH7034642.1 Vta1 like-domain-containing protein [Microdochium trichocladiopsis]
MALEIPPPIKGAGLTPFILRARQLETAKPVVSYWCLYWAVNQILGKGLHNVDQQCLEFTTNLMDQLEQTKTANADNDAVTDDLAGQAYVEQFAQETFDRAQRTLKADKVTQQTAVTFEAAATFFQLTNIWGQAEPETQEKVKYAKWNAARILKAIKAGEDPNLSNPKQEEPAQEQELEVTLDPNDPEVKAIGDAAQPRSVQIEDVPDDGSYNRLMRPSPQPSPGPVSEPTSPPPSSAPAPDQVSPILPSDQASAEPEGYFPKSTSGYEEDDPPFSLPSAPSMPAGGIPSPSSHDPGVPMIPSPPSTRPNVDIDQPAFQPDTPSAPQDFYKAKSAPPPAHQPSAPVAPANVVPTAHRPQAQATRSHGPTVPVATGVIDDVAMAQAQKHAKWAISALNFEDVPTAIRELRAALATLGAQ